jgi:EmrB/QacA subfamily drug resistance transporter
MNATRRPVGLVVLTCALPVFMVALDNLIVSTALTAIRADFGGDAAQLQWVVSAYILGFAGFQLPGAAFGDRFGRRRVLVIGTVAFTAASALCGLSDSLGQLTAARAVQGTAAGAVMPLTLTMLSEAVPEKMRDAAVGIWSGITGLAIAMGPVVGGAVVEGLSWRWIFWLNLPVGVLAVALALVVLRESRGGRHPLDLLGMALAAGSVISLVWAIVHAEQDGWTAASVVSAFVLAAVLLVGLVMLERIKGVLVEAKHAHAGDRVSAPLLPLSFYRSRPFVLTNLVSLAMNFGVFGSIFLLAQYLQFAQGHGPLAAGERTLAWTLMPMIFAPLAGVFCRRVGAGRLMGAGLLLQAAGLSWIVSIAAPTTPFLELLPPMAIAGAGMGLVYAPVSVVVLSSVAAQHRGQASGANTTLREVGGALGTAVLATVFATHGGYGSPEDFIDGMRPAVWVGVAVVLAGAVAGFFIPHRREAPADGATPVLFEPAA